MSGFTMRTKVECLGFTRSPKTHDRLMILELRSSELRAPIRVTVKVESATAILLSDAEPNERNVVQVRAHVSRAYECDKHFEDVTDKIEPQSYDDQRRWCRTEFETPQLGYIVSKDNDYWTVRVMNCDWEVMVLPADVEAY